MSDWESVIGLEIHAQLATVSKIFSGASTAFGAAPNTQACVVDLGMPGVLPVLNHEAVNMAIRFGVAIGAEIDHHSVFARKNYFYPDLPKGYQISQFELPIVGKGHIFISPDEGVSKEVGITRAHLEEDAGKSIHDQFPEQTAIDLNRAGTPLLEIVSEQNTLAGALPGNLRWQYAGRFVSLRCQRFGATQRRPETRNPRRAEEYQLFSFSRTRHQP
jgi:aspartyl-tRNA(Asn)/glutamyl-tRNA(Gln) amidotransferase subunit B